MGQKPLARQAHLKGVLDAEDARLGLAAGADAIVVSNHGGRQLDGAPSSISVLQEIVATIDGRCEVLFDGGIRSGQDIAKALALGARGALIGRSFLYALAAAGEAGVTKAIEIMRNELRVTLALTGTSTIDAVGPHILRAVERFKSSAIRAAARRARTPFRF